MARRYDSFVLRCWRLSDDEQRIEVEHLQSGGRKRVAGLAAAVDWITMHYAAAGARAGGAGPRPAAPAEEVTPSEPGATVDEQIA